MNQIIKKADRPTCDCGTTRESENARKVVKYSTWGMIAMGLVGISATPTDVLCLSKMQTAVWPIVERRKKIEILIIVDPRSW